MYSLHPGYAMEASTIANLPKKTGKSLDEWIEIVRRDGPDGEKEAAAWLKREHGLGTFQSEWIAVRLAGRSPADEYRPEELVEALFSGAKAHLRPLYEKLLSIGMALGPDVKACPCATMVPLYRKHVFAQIKPTTNSRIDLGFALGDRKVEGNLIDTGGFVKKDRITHRIPISSVDEIDDETLRWLRAAYERTEPGR